MGVVDDLHRAREAYERREWVSAYRTLSDLDESDLTAGDFAALATTAYLLGRRNDCVQAPQRAYQVNVDQGERARCGALRALARHGARSRAVRRRSRADGWSGRSGCWTRSRATWSNAATCSSCRRSATSSRASSRRPRRLAPQVTDYGRRFHDPDLLAVGSGLRGTARDLLRAGGRRAAGARRGDGGGARRRGLRRVLRAGVLLGDRGLPGGLGPRPGR